MATPPPAAIAPAAPHRTPRPSRASLPATETESVDLAVSVAEADSAADTDSVSAIPSLTPELSLLRRAQAARRSGDPSRALTLLDAHARDFPSAVMAPERDAARVLTLCDLGRVEEARAARARFLDTYPNSPLSARVRAACAP